MKKILISIMIIAVVAAIAVGGTMAFFTQSTEVQGNTLGVATYNVPLSGTMAVPVSVTGLMPGETREVGYMIVKNQGEVAAWMHAFTEDFGGTGYAALSPLLTLTVTLMGDDYTGYDYYSIYPGDWKGVVHQGSVESMYLSNVGPGNPIEPWYMGVYKVEVTLDSAATIAVQGKTFTFDLVFETTQVRSDDTKPADTATRW